MRRPYPTTLYPEGEDAVSEYYLNAPVLVSAIEQRADDEIYKAIYAEIRTAIGLVNCDRQEEAYIHCMGVYK